MTKPFNYWSSCVQPPSNSKRPRSFRTVSAPGIGLTCVVPPSSSACRLTSSRCQKHERDCRFFEENFDLDDMLHYRIWVSLLTRRAYCVRSLFQGGMFHLFSSNLLPTSILCSKIKERKICS